MSSRSSLSSHTGDMDLDDDPGIVHTTGTVEVPTRPDYVSFSLVVTIESRSHRYSEVTVGRTAKKIEKLLERYEIPPALRPDDAAGSQALPPPVPWLTYARWPWLAPPRDLRSLPSLVRWDRGNTEYISRHANSADARRYPLGALLHRTSVVFPMMWRDLGELDEFFREATRGRPFVRLSDRATWGILPKTAEMIRLLSFPAALDSARKKLVDIQYGRCPDHHVVFTCERYVGLPTLTGLEAVTYRDANRRGDGENRQTAVRADGGVLVPSIIMMLDVDVTWRLCQ